eukprot:8173409-Pyramimonas_sp.AAC.1
MVDVTPQRFRRSGQGNASQVVTPDRSPTRLCLVSVATFCRPRRSVRRESIPALPASDGSVVRTSYPRR